MHRFVPYYRVSSVKNGSFGFGLKDQRKFLKAYLTSSGLTPYRLAREHVELRNAGSLTRRPELKAALEECRRKGATLLIARLRRLKRDATFLHALLNSGVNFRACDIPQADRSLVRRMATKAEVQAAEISRRTKEAMAAAKLRGSRFGNRVGETLLTNKQRKKGRLKGLVTIRRRSRRFALSMVKDLMSLEATGIKSATGIARALNERGVRTRKGGMWSAMQVQRMRDVLDESTGSSASSVAKKSPE